MGNDPITVETTVSAVSYTHLIGIGPTIEMSDDMEADMAKIREWYAPWQGKNRGTT